MTLALRAWLDAGRPKTLPLALIAILTGSVLALAHGGFSWPVLLLSLLTASLLQILSNLANDYGDGLRGVDNPQRLGPLRALQSGALSARQLRNSLFVVGALTMASGLALITLAGLDTTSLLAFIALGLLAMVAAVTYTVGRKPYGYAGLGDLSVWLFFGWLGVAGSYYLHGTPFTPLLLMPASASGFLAVAVLNINNMRDIDNDARHGKRTLVVRLGLARARLYHTLLLSAAWLLFLACLPGQLNNPWLALLFVPSLWPLAVHLKAVFAARTSAAMAPLLPVMVGCSALVHMLFATPLILSALLDP